MMNSHIPSKQKTSPTGNNKNEGEKKKKPVQWYDKRTMRKIRTSKSNEDGQQDREN